LWTIYFADIDTFIGDVPPPPTNDDEEMMHEAAMGHIPRVQIPCGMHRRLDTRFRLELGDRLSSLLTEVGVLRALMREIKEDPTLLDIWREMSRDLMLLMHHIVRVSRLIRTRRAPDDRHNSSSITSHSSSTPSIDEGGHDHPSPHPPPSPHPNHEEATHIPPPLHLI
jgi:hypothetical protein